MTDLDQQIGHNRRLSQHRPTNRMRLFIGALTLFVFFACSSEERSIETLTSIELSPEIKVTAYGGSLLKSSRLEVDTLEAHQIELSMDGFEVIFEVESTSCSPHLFALALPYSIDQLKLNIRTYKRVIQASPLLVSENLNTQLTRGETQYEATSPSTPFTSSSTQARSTADMERTVWLTLNHGHQSANLSLTPPASNQISAQADQVCGQPQSLEDDPPQTLTRIQIVYPYSSPLKIGVITQVRGDLERLEQRISSLKRAQVSALILLGGLSREGTRSQLEEVRSTLRKSGLFWWVLPDRVDLSSGLPVWQSIFGATTYASDLGKYRLIFLDLSSGALLDEQLKLISRWRDLASPLLDTLTPVNEIILMSLIPLVNPNEEGSEVTYKLGALRVLNLLRQAQTKHHFVMKSSLRGYMEMKLLGLRILGVPTLEEDALLLELDPECPLSSDQCLAWQLVSLED